MGRGLSPLQKNILAIALESQEAETRYYFDVDKDDQRPAPALFRSELLARLWGWPLKEPVARRSFQDGKLYCSLFPHSVKRLDRKQIGNANYNRAQASLTRALRRLTQR